MRYPGLLLRLTQFILRHAISFARSPLGSACIGGIFAHMSFAIPVQRLRDTPNLMAFHHPRPGYPFHVLIVPKRAIKGPGDLSAADASLLVEVFQTVDSLVAEFDLEETGYRLVVNGGKYQDVAQLHFHLLSESDSFLNSRSKSSKGR